MQDQGDSDVPGINTVKRFPRRKSPLTASRYFTSKPIRHSHRNCSITTLEHLLSEQNIFIERLRNDLQNEREIVDRLKQENVRRESLHCNQVQALKKELDDVKKLLAINGIDNASQESFDSFKNRIEEDLRQAFCKTLDNVKFKHRKEYNELEMQYKDALSRMTEGSHLKELALDKQIHLLSDAVCKLNQTCQSLEDVWDPGQYQPQLEYLNKSLDAIRNCEKELSPAISSLNQKLVDSVRRETNIWKEFHSFKIENFKLKDELNSLKKKLGQYKSLSPADDVFVDLAPVDVSTHNLESSNSGSGQKFVTLSNVDQYEIVDTNTLTEFDSVLSYVKKLKKYLKDMVTFYNVRLNNYIGLDPNVCCLKINPNQTDDLAEVEISLPKSNRLMINIKDCHRLIFCLNELLKSLDINLDETMKEYKEIENEMIKLKSAYRKEFVALNSHNELLNEKLAACMAERKSLEGTISEIRSKSVSKDQFDLICKENEELINLKNKLEEVVNDLKEKKLKSVKIDKAVDCGDNSVESQVEMNKTPDFNDSFVLPAQAFTSTPFHPKPSETKKGLEFLKSNLLEWIERCQNIEFEKNQLEKKLFNLNITFNQTEFIKRVLEQEIDILRDNIKHLENKVTDYVSLQEKCHILENDNSLKTIKLSFLTEVQDSQIKIGQFEEVKDTSLLDYTGYINLNIDSFETSLAKLNFIHEFQKKNQKIIHLEAKCQSKEALIEEISLKLKQSNELGKHLENKLNNIICDNNEIYDKLLILIEENSQLSSDKHIAEIELKSTKDQLNYLVMSSGNSLKDYSFELRETFKNDAMKFLKDSIEKWCEMEQKLIDTRPSSNVESLDARHCIEILTKNNNLLKNDKEELLLKLTELQHQFNYLLKDQEIDEGWFLQVEKYERELLKVIKDQNKQYGRIEEALRSTGKLHNELQKHCDQHKVQLREISSLQKRLEEEKQKYDSSENQRHLIEKDLKDMEKCLQETVIAKKKCEDKLKELEKEFIEKEKKYKSEIMRTKWMSHYSQNKSIDFMVKRDLSIFRSELFDGIADREKNRCDHIELLYQRSIDSLRYLLQQEKSQALSDLSAEHQKKMKESFEIVQDQILKIEDLKANEQLREIIVGSDLENEIISLSKIEAEKEEHKRQFEIAFKALNELHNEEIMIIKLKMEAEKNAELYNLSQDQLKREKELLNSFSQMKIDPGLPVFNQFKVSVVNLFLRYVQMFLPMWEKMYNKDVEILENKYEQLLNCETMNEHIEIEASKEIENIIYNQSLIVDNSQNFINKLDNCLSCLLKSAHEFFNNNCEELNALVKNLKSDDCPENIASLHQQIRSIQMEKEELEQKQKAAVQLLLSDHEEELLKIRTLVEGLNKINTDDQEVALDKLRSELEEKHAKEVEELRTYFERKCAELEKHYSEEIFSQQSRKMSIVSSSSESELISEENSVDTPFQATLIVTDECLSQIPEGTNLLTELYSDHDAENGLLVERYFVDLNAMDQVLLKHKLVIDRVVAYWKTRLEMIYANLKSKYSDRLENEISSFKDIEEKVQSILKDVKEDSVRELEWLNSLQSADILEQSLRLEIEKQYENKISDIINDYEDRLVKETSNLTQLYKKRELEAVWAAKVEAEQTYRLEIHTVESKWEKKYVADMASFLSDKTIEMAFFEENLTTLLESFTAHISKKYSILENKMCHQISRLKDLQDKVATISEKNTAEFTRLKEQCNIEKEVVQKNCNNIIKQMDIDAKQSCDVLISMYEKELARLNQAHEEEMKLTMDKHNEQMALLKDKMTEIPTVNEDELYEKAREHAVERIVDYLSKQEESALDGSAVNFPPEFSGLEQLFKNRYEIILRELSVKHQEELEQLKRNYQQESESLTKVTQEDDESDSSKSTNITCRVCNTGGSEEMDKLIRERDSLRKLTESLKSAVGQLTSYLHNCEDELNHTVVEHLLKGAISVENSPAKISTGRNVRRVHFAPDVSRILETTYNDDTDGSVDISYLDDPDVSAKLKHELDACLLKLKTEAAALLGLSTSNHSAPLSLPKLTPLSEMAQRLLADRTSPSAEIMNIIDELTLEGDRLIEELQHEKEDLQQQIKAADHQLRSTRNFLEDQAAEREVERDEYSRELSLLQAHIKQTTPDTKHQSLTLQIEDLEKQVKDTASSLIDAETRKKELEDELKSTTEKVWVLTDIINKLESQLLIKSDREECLEKRLDELEAELEQQSMAQHAMVQEMESLKSREENEGNYMEQLAALQEEMKLQYSSNSIRNIKAQLREIEKGIESRTKELEGLNLNSSSTSLSSPSEEISIREHLDMIRCQTPEFCPSPVALPVDEVNKLQEKIHRHFRSEEMIIKKVKDQDLQIKKFNQILGEVQAEREALQQTVDKLNSQLGKANTKVDDLRRKAETAKSDANKDFSQKITELEENVGCLKQELDQVHSQLQLKDDQLKRAKESIDNQTVKLRNLSQADPEIVNALRLELASTMSEKNKLQELVEKYKNEAELSPLYSCLLNDKNEDIQQLRRTVSLLENQTAPSMELRDKGGGDSASVIGKTVSFAEELSPIARPISPLRDAQKMLSFPYPSQLSVGDKTSGVFGPSAIHSLDGDRSLSPNTSMINFNPQLMRSDNEEKVLKLESEVNNLRSLVTDLTDAKRDVESYISSFTDDRKYYESQLNKLLDEKKFQDDEIEKLCQTLEKKDNEIKNTTADVNKLQVILGNLQEKLKQASKFASKDNELKKELSEMKEKCSTLEDVLDKFYKFRDELGTLNDDFKFRDSNSYDYFQNILETLRQKLRKSTDIELSNSNLKRQLDNSGHEINKLKLENEQLISELHTKKDIYLDEITSLKLQIDQINLTNSKLKNENFAYQQLKQDNIDLSTKVDKLTLSKNLMEVELNSLKSENNKLTEELDCIKTELKFKNVNDSCTAAKEKDLSDPGVSVPAESEHVADLEDLTCEIEKQLDLSAKLDNSLLNTLEDKSCCKKNVTAPSAAPIKDAVASVSSKLSERQTERGLVNWLAKEVDAWQSAGSKQSQLSSQLNNLSRLVQTQDNRITRLLVELDGKKKECLVMELDLLRERSNLKQAQCLLDSERQRARTIQKEDTHLIETLRIRLETALKAESRLKNLISEERQKCEALEACLNSAKALESYIQTSSDSESSQNIRNQLMLRIEVDRLKQINNDLETVISRERSTQSSLKDKIKLLQLQNQSLEKQLEDLVYKLNEESRFREYAENQLKLWDQNMNNSSSKSERDTASNNVAMENVLAEIKLWKDECLQLRECIRLQREHEDYWASNVQTPLIKQLNDVNRSLEALVREKITLQTYVDCIEKERDFLRNRVQKLEELNEKLSSTTSHSPHMTAKLNLQSVLNKLQYLAELNHKMESHRKALIWQKRYLLVAISGYKRSTENIIDRISPNIVESVKKKQYSFRIVVHVIRACIKLNYICKRRKASRLIFVNKIKAEINLASSSKSMKKSSNEVISTNSPGFMSLSPPSRDLYAVPRFIDENSLESEPSKLSHYVAMFDQMQKRLGKIMQNENS